MKIKNLWKMILLLFAAIIIVMISVEYYERKDVVVSPVAESYLDSDQLGEISRKAEGGDALSATRLTIYYLDHTNNLEKTLYWMEKSIGNGGTRFSSSTVSRLRNIIESTEHKNKEYKDKE